MTIDSSSIPALLTSLLALSLGAIGVLWNRYEKKLDTIQTEHSIKVSAIQQAHREDIRTKDEAISNVVREHMADLRKQDASSTYQEQRVQELIEKLHEMMTIVKQDV